MLNATGPAAADLLEEADRLGVAGCDRATSLELRGAAAMRWAAALLDDAGDGAAEDGAAAWVRVGCGALAVDDVLLTNDCRWPDVEEVCSLGDCVDEDDFVTWRCLCLFFPVGLGLAVEVLVRFLKPPVPDPLEFFWKFGLF